MALAVYRVLTAVENKEAVPPYEDCKNQLLGIARAYLDHDGPLPYNGFSAMAYTQEVARKEFAAQGYDVEDIAMYHDVYMFKVMDTVLMEHCRVWLELSGVKDVTHPIH
jgi:hypothetical protein